MSEIFLPVSAILVAFGIGVETCAIALSIHKVSLKLVTIVIYCLSPPREPMGSVLKLMEYDLKLVVGVL